jgi:tetratricopeptide (TPR) repeat protein
VTAFQGDLAESYNNLGDWYLGAGDSAAAASLYQKTREIRERLATINLRDSGMQRLLAKALTNLGIARSAAGERAEAVRAYHQSRSILAAIVSANPDDLESRGELSRLLGHLGVVLAGLGRSAEARDLLNQGREDLRLICSRAPQIARYREYLIEHYHNQARGLRLLGQPAEAAEAARECLKIARGDQIELYRIACDFALCIPLVGQPASALTADPQAERRKYTDLAMDALRQAVASGFADGERLATDPDLAPLRSRDDLRVILSDLAFPTDPFAP